jgi:hypothetical protein
MNTEVIIIIVVAVLVLLAVVAFFLLKKEKFSRATLSNLQYTENIINRLVNQLESNLSPTDLTSIFNLTITCITENLVYINIAAKSIPGSPQYMSALQTISDNLYKYNSGTSFYPVAQSLFDLYFSIRLYTNVLSQLNTNANYNKVLTYFPQFPSLLSQYS